MFFVFVFCHFSFLVYALWIEFFCSRYYDRILHDFFFCLFSLAEEILRDEVEEYVKNRRGKELPGFVNYRTFENIVKKHIEELEEPALKLLKDITGESLMMAESKV